MADVYCAQKMGESVGPLAGDVALSHDGEKHYCGDGAGQSPSARLRFGEKTRPDQPLPAGAFVVKCLFEWLI